MAAAAYGGSNGGGIWQGAYGARRRRNAILKSQPAAGAPAMRQGATGAGDLTGPTWAPRRRSALRGPRVIANPMNNTLLIQATPQEYESIEQLIKELDVPPRQVLIEAKIYSIDLTHAFSSDVTAALQALSGTSASTSTTGSSAPTTAASLLGALSRRRRHVCRLPCWWARTAISLGRVTLMEQRATPRSSPLPRLSPPTAFLPPSASAPRFPRCKGPPPAPLPGP